MTFEEMMERSRKQHRERMKMMQRQLDMWVAVQVFGGLTVGGVLLFVACSLRS